MDGLIAYALAKKYTDEHGGGGEDSTKTLSGNGAPTGSVVAKKGDLYLDTTNNQAYMCTQYNDPSAITTLTGLTITFKEASSMSLGSNSFFYNINFTSSDNTPYDVVSYSGSQYGELSYRKAGTSNYQTIGKFSGYPITWYVEAGRTITISGGTDASNADLISIVISNADSITGVGSQWIALDSELPIVSSSDNGKLLGVDNGGWGKVVNPAIIYHSGVGAPTSSIFAKVGDIYRDTTNNKLYQCSQYNSPTTLLNKTVSFNTSLNFSDVTEDAEYNIVFTYGSNNSNGIKLTTEGRMYYKNSGTGNYTQVYYNGTWNNIYGDEITVSGGTDVENQSLLNFIQHNGSVSGTGSTWVEVKAIASNIPASTKNKSILQGDGSGGWTEATNTIDFYASGSSSQFVRLNPSGNMQLWSSSTMKANLSTADLTFKNGTYDISVRRSAFDLLGARKDDGVQTISTNSDLNTAPFCRPGNYGYVNDATAATLQNCPVSTSFEFKVLTTSQQMYNDSTNYQSWSYNMRIIITWDTKVYVQSAYYENSGSWTFGPWNRITTSAEVPNAPTTDGNYVLKCSVSDGTPTYTWVEET